MFAKLQAPEGCTSCSWMGKVFAAIDGVLMVPAEAFHELKYHGFELLEHIESEEEKAEKAIAEEAAKLEAEKEAAKEKTEAEAEKEKAILDATAALEDTKKKLESETDSDAVQQLKEIYDQQEAALAALNNG
jgi:predicted  nucleic acid-binding Zn-ribbon protein